METGARIRGAWAAYTADGMIRWKSNRLFWTRSWPDDRRALPEEGLPYMASLFWADAYGGGPLVLEYNLPHGDPETQPLMMRMDFDLAAALDAVASRKLASFSPHGNPAERGVVMTSGGYPDHETGKRIEDWRGPMRCPMSPSFTRERSGTPIAVDAQDESPLRHVDGRPLRSRRERRRHRAAHWPRPNPYDSLSGFVGSRIPARSHHHARARAGFPCGLEGRKLSGSDRVKAAARSKSIRIDQRLRSGSPCGNCIRAPGGPPP